MLCDKVVDVRRMVRFQSEQVIAERLLKVGKPPFRDAFRIDQLQVIAHAMRLLLDQHAKQCPALRIAEQDHFHVAPYPVIALEQLLERDLFLMGADGFHEGGDA